MNIQIKTGSNLSRLLQSTVNIPQAFTELVKNSIQNFATSCSIELQHPYYGDSHCRAIITDDGQGFDHITDENGMNAFDKYFVFGNSYDLTSGGGIRLGQMGIGGKLANDKLSHEVDIHWTIETKNMHGKCFIVTYKPSGVEFLNEYSPSIEEISPDKCSISTASGTKITIVSTKRKLKLTAGILRLSKTSLGLSLGILYLSSKKKEKNSLSLNGESLEFIYKLPGSNMPIFNRSFEYDYYGEQKTANIEFRLSLVYARYLLANHPLKNIDIISKVKICPFHLTDQDLLESTVSILQSKSKDTLPDKEKIQKYLISLLGLYLVMNYLAFLTILACPLKIYLTILSVKITLLQFPSLRNVTRPLLYGQSNTSNLMKVTR